MEQYLSNAMVPFLIALVLVYYSIRLLVLKDVSAIRGKSDKKVKNEEQYVKTAGKLMLFLAASSLGMAIIMYWSSLAALAVMGVCLIVFGLLWKRMNAMYGE